MTDVRLSIVAQFDELVRNGNVLTAGIEPEFCKFTVHQDLCRKRWLDTEENYGPMKKKIKHLECDNDTLQTKLKHARSQIDHEIRKRQKAEQERDSLERQIMLVRELLTDNRGVLNDRDREKLAFLSTDFTTSQYQSPKRNLTTIEESQSLLSPSDISFDKTEDDLDVTYLRSGKKYKRPSAPPEDILDHETNRDRVKRRKSRKHRRSRSAVVATTTVTVEDGSVATQAEITTDDKQRRNSSPIKRGMKKYHSDSKRDERMDSDDEFYYNRRNRGILKESIYSSTPQTPPSPQSPGMRHYSSTGRSLNKVHSFQSKTIIKPETCIPCGRKIKFGKAAMKCRDCRATAHPECKDQVPLPCVPTMTTPGTNKSNLATISDYAPSDPPMIPAIVIHCVNEVESRGLEETGIYRVPGSEKEVKDLKEKFLRGKGTPNLAHVDDIHVVCGCLKDFLRGLKEPLVTFQYWNDFVRAAEMRDADEGLSSMYQAISELPRPNRDTMAFLILHLQRIAECVECKMPVGNLTKVFGPTMIGYSMPDPEPMQMINETRKQQIVMEKLMNISCDYWCKFINIDDNEIHAYDGMTPNTPETKTVLKSMLGPIGTPNENDTPIEKKSWFTPKFGSKGSRVNKKPAYFFSTSPSLR